MQCKNRYIGYYRTVEEAVAAYALHADPETKRLTEYVVDRKFANFVSSIHWHPLNKGHLCGSAIGVGRVLMHRLIWELCGGQKPEPGQEIDHIDRDPTNNTSANLRLITRRGNILNQSSANCRFSRGKWAVRFGKSPNHWERRYFDRDTALLVAKHRKELLIEREVIAYAPVQ